MCTNIDPQQLLLLAIATLIFFIFALGIETGGTDINVSPAIIG